MFNCTQLTILEIGRHGNLLQVVGAEHEYRIGVRAGRVAEHLGAVLQYFAAADEQHLMRLRNAAYPFDGLFERVHTKIQLYS